MIWIYFTFNARDKTVRTKVFLLILDSQSDFANDNLFRRICLAISIDVIGQGQDICFTKMQIQSVPPWTRHRWQTQWIIAVRWLCHKPMSGTRMGFERPVCHIRTSHSGLRMSAAGAAGEERMDTGRSDLPVPVHKNTMKQNSTHIRNWSKDKLGSPIKRQARSDIRCV